MSVTGAGLFEFDHSFVRELDGLFVAWQPSAVPAPELLVLNHELAESLGLDAQRLASPEGLAVLAGNAVPESSIPVAMAYAGHQFGGYSPRLGDGRALLLGELFDVQGHRRDVHLKGSGRTPFARGGDGKAAVGPMLREYLIGEAMFALGIPTTRALSVVATGELIAREGMLPGAVLTRVASSHLRVGTFEYAARLGDAELMSRLVNHAIDRHHPKAADSERPALELLDRVVAAQAELVARWMLVGFIHGVMNTDNMTISGETIDYGPCAFMDAYDPATVYSSIDHGGRYAYANQPRIAQWNLTRLAETLLPLIDAEGETAVALATDVLTTFPDRFRTAWQSGMRAKLGLLDGAERDQALFDDLLAVMHTEHFDLTTTFRTLGTYLAGGPVLLPEPLAEWTARWEARLATEGRTRSVVAASMNAVNPIYIPRNHLVEEALAAGSSGDLAPFQRLLAAVRSPYSERDGFDAYAEPAPEGFGRHYRTFCGT
jgi:uncharacterized protein YdiU (UPF0061 family)